MVGVGKPVPWEQLSTWGQTQGGLSPPPGVLRTPFLVATPGWRSSTTTPPVHRPALRIKQPMKGIDSMSRLTRSHQTTRFFFNTRQGGGPALTPSGLNSLVVDRGDGNTTNKSPLANNLRRRQLATCGSSFCCARGAAVPDCGRGSGSDFRVFCGLGVAGRLC